MRPLLLAHRGARKHAPENTVAALRLALEHGCDGFEFDLRRSADAQCILCHDSRLAGRDVEKFSYADLREHHRRKKKVKTEDECLPVLDAVLNAFPGAFLDLEIKISGIEEQVAAAVRVHAPKRYVVSSFLPEVIHRYRDLVSDAPLGYISQTSRRLALWPSLPIQAVFVYRTLLSRRLVEEIHSAGLQVFVWTVNASREMARFAEWQVDGLIADDTKLLVATVREVLARRAS